MAWDTGDGARPSLPIGDHEALRAALSAANVQAALMVHTAMAEHHQFH